MREFRIKFLIIATLIIAGLVFFNTVLFHQARLNFSPLSQERAKWFDLATQAKEFFGYIKEWNSLAKENKDLKSQLAINLARVAKEESLKQENDSLRATLELSKKFDRPVIPGGIFNINLSSDGYTALINKGLKDGLKKGDVIITNNNELVGVIDSLFTSSARVILINDPSFKTTVRVLDGSVSGIAHGALKDGLTLELIIQTDDIKEGDILISTGNDTIPAGLIVGVVNNVQGNESQLFKNVKVKPSSDFSSGSILVIKL
jgi:rod shape-determining protein MreC